MALFGRNKHKQHEPAPDGLPPIDWDNSPGPEDTPSPWDIRLGKQVGRRTMQAAMAPERPQAPTHDAETGKPLDSYAREIKSRMVRLEGRQQEFLWEAYQKNVPKEDLATLVADAMNGGVLPRIIRGHAEPGQAKVHLLDGKVTPELLQVEADRAPGQGPNGDFIGSIGFSQSYAMGEVQPDATFSKTTIDGLPLTGDNGPLSENDKAALRMIDDSMTTAFYAGGQAGGLVTRGGPDGMID